MRYTAKQYAQALHQAIFESAEADQEKILDNFVAVLKENRDLSRIPEIEQEFFNYEREIRGTKVAEVTSAKGLSKSEETQIIKSLNEYLGVQVELKKKVDEGLVGGVVIKIGDELIDGSVRKNLNNLKEKLIKL